WGAVGGPGPCTALCPEAPSRAAPHTGSVPPRTAEWRTRRPRRLALPAWRAASPVHRRRISKRIVTMRRRGGPCQASGLPARRLRAVGRHRVGLALVGLLIVLVEAEVLAVVVEHDGREEHLLEQRLDVGPAALDVGDRRVAGRAEALDGLDARRCPFAQAAEIAGLPLRRTAARGERQHRQEERAHLHAAGGPAERDSRSSALCLIVRPSTR